MTRPWRKYWVPLANPYRLASLFGLIVLLVLVPRVALDAGFSYDELVHLEYGDLILAWYRSNFEQRGALDWRNLYLYGGLFDLASQWLISTDWLPWGPYETRHVLTLYLAVLGVVATWFTANSIGGPRAGLIAGVTLAVTPSWVGHGMFNPKDVPFGAAAAFVMYASVAIAMSPAPLRWRHALYAAIAFGAALGVRPGGMFLSAFVLLAAFGRIALQANTDGQVRTVRNVSITVARILCVLPLAWALMLSAWPWAQLDPFVRPFEAASIAAHFDWGGEMRFNGRTITTGDLPLTYLPVWYAVTLPETYFFGFLCGLVSLGLFVRRWATVISSRGLALLCLLAFVCVPLLGVLIKRPTIYDGNRHFLFLLPAMAALTGVALSKFLEHVEIPRAVRLGVAGLWSVLALLVVVDMRAIHPYEYVYFNRLYGGLAAADGNFETDYWGASFREGFAWVVDNVQSNNKKPLKVAVCGASPGQWQVEYLRKRWGVKKLVIVHDEHRKHQIYLGFTRGNCHKRDGEVIHVVERLGVPLLYVLRR